MRKVFIGIFNSLIATALFIPVMAHADDFTDNTKGLTQKSGFVDLYIDSKKNKVLARIPNAESGQDLLRAIYTARLTAGLGSNPVGLDRGWGDSGKVILFKRYGNKVIVEAENLQYRATSSNTLEQKAVRESFAPSFIASLGVLAEKSDGSVLVDLTDFLTRDALGIVQHLKDRKQGSFARVDDRSFVDTSAVHAFPDNAEIDVFLTFSSSDPGREVATTASTGSVATLIQHHSFVRLPKPGFTSLPSDPRMGAIEDVHYDYSAPLSGTIVKRIARRYRLEKDASGKTIKPIVFYIDSGAPEPVRSALVEGASWWKEAFAAAGYPDGYRVELLPADYHPLDVRYNVVQWVHRQTRGWSYGGGVFDPRTGEMLKGHVNLGSLRVRQDRMIFEGLAGTAKTGTGAEDDPSELALDRIRQLSAHEVGHALGFAHNFAASAYGKGSVMDYPAPDVKVTNGKLDFSQTYGVGVGPWDKHVATLLYADLSTAGRAAKISKAQQDGLLYVADSDARSIGTGHPKGAVWDNGNDAAETLNQVMAVRATALSDFGPSRLRSGQPLSDLNKVIVPIYLYHRYQTAAAAKMIGGVTFDYGVTGVSDQGMTVMPVDAQKRALRAVLSTVAPEALDLSDTALSYLMPSLVSYSIADSDRELFKHTAYPVFDLVSAADTAAGLTFDTLLNPVRAARLIELKRRDNGQLGFDEMLETIANTVMQPALSGRTGEISRAVQARYVYDLMALADNSSATPAVKARAHTALLRLSKSFSRRNSDHSSFMVSEIRRYENRPANAVSTITPEKALPPGSPIGSNMGNYEECWHC
ncbi:MAG: zinc-dependent metalloprotease [Alphaproteobacteria bacterium]